jgi:hypothetical protein
MDVHVRRAITDELRRRGVDVLTAQEDESAQLNDSDLLTRATVLGRVLFSQDNDLLREATSRQRNHLHFAGVLYAHQLRITIGNAIEDLELIAKIAEPSDLESRVEYLPL